QGLHHDVRVAVDVVHQIFRGQAAVDVGRAAGREVDQHGQALALVERLLRLRGRHGKGGGGAEPEQGGTDRAHGRFPLALGNVAHVVVDVVAHLGDTTSMARTVSFISGAVSYSGTNSIT